ncbi:hypothetical protein ACFL44_02760, partial [Gemmatimonadota bacterium]
MKHYDLDRLSFGELLERIAQGTYTPRGGTALRNTLPLEDVGAIQAQQEVISEVGRATDSSPPIPFNTIPEVDDQLKRLRRTGALLDSVELRDLALVSRLLDALGEWGELYGNEQLPATLALHGFPARYRDETERVTRAIDRNGRVKDDATVLLASLRRKIITLQEKLRQSAHDITERLYRKGIAQEPEPALREGRYVVSVRAESQAEVSGVAIDRSRSGQSVFIEPREISETALELKEAVRDEEREVERILTELSAMF